MKISKRDRDRGPVVVRVMLDPHDSQHDYWLHRDRAADLYKMGLLERTSEGAYRCLSPTQKVT